MYPCQRSLKWIAFAAVALAPLVAQTHKQWLLPSATTVAGSDPWVTVDAAISNDLFHPDHYPASLDRLVITAPDGRTIKPENAITGKYRSAFDVHLAQQGTYKLALVSHGLSARYEVDGEKKRWRGSVEQLATELPAAATNVRVTESSNRVETFVTNGKPNDTALKPQGQGLELVPVSQVTGLFAGEPATFQLLLDGKPAAGVKVSAIAGAVRYRNAPEALSALTGEDGKFQITWPHAGMYWVNASVSDDNSSVKQADQRRASYTATFEVLPE